MQQPDQAPSPQPQAAESSHVQHPAAMLAGLGHRIIHANAQFVAEFGTECVGLPASEALIDWPGSSFALLDRVFRDGAPLKRRIVINGIPRTLTVAPRREFGSDEVYGVMLHLVPRE